MYKNFATPVKMPHFGDLGDSVTQLRGIFEFGSDPKSRQPSGLVVVPARTFLMVSIGMAEGEQQFTLRGFVI